MTVEVIDQNADWSGVDGAENVLPFLPDFADSLYAAYLFGTDFPNGPGFDYSTNGRHADVTGASILGNHAAFGTGSMAVAPFNPNQLCARTSDCTLISISKVPVSSPSQLISSLSGIEDSITLDVGPTHNGRVVLYDDGTASQQILQNGAADSNRSTRYEMWAGVFDGVTAKCRRRYDGGAMVAPNGTASTKVPGGGTHNFQMGYPPAGTGYPGPFDTACDIYFDGALTDVELEAVYQWLRTFLADYDIAV